MGILNLTPDSFSDGGRGLDTDVAAAVINNLFFLSRSFSLYFFLCFSLSLLLLLSIPLSLFSLCLFSSAIPLFP